MLAQTYLNNVVTSPIVGGSTLSCDVAIFSGDSHTTLAGGYLYSALVTPEVTQVHPARGGTAGGTRVTIDGVGFG